MLAQHLSLSTFETEQSKGERRAARKTGCHDRGAHLEAPVRPAGEDEQHERLQAHPQHEAEPEALQPQVQPEREHDHGRHRDAVVAHEVDHRPHELLPGAAQNAWRRRRRQAGDANTGFVIATSRIHTYGTTVWSAFHYK